MRKRLGLTAVVAAVSFFSGGWLMQGATARATPDGPRLLGEVLDHVTKYYVDSLSADSIYAKASHGLVEQLGDPYSTLMEREDFKQITEMTTGNYGGLGMQIDVREGWITVVAPLPETPAERAGIEAGDQIVEVNGKVTRDLNQDDAVKTLRGAPGTRVDIKIRRPGIPQPMPFALTRETIHYRSVQPGILFDGGIGLIALTPVIETSSDELRAEVNALRAKGMKSLIFDLRGNPGGLLTEGITVSELFLDRGQGVVSTRGRVPEMNKSYAAQSTQPWPEMPVVVLVNEWSASAAEIIAGALQDNDRAIVIGTATFGKGLVQTLFPIGNDRALKLTTARWFTPSGRTIQRDAKNQEAQVEQATAEALGRDSVKRVLPTFKTVGGRTVKGGGGIVPDRIVRGDTLTDAEKTFAKALGSNVAAYRDALVSTALEAKEKKLVTSEGFPVTDQMRQLVLSKLAAKGVVMSPEQIAGGRALLDDQLAYEISRYVFGRQAEIRRRSSDDPQVRAAIELLKRAPTRAALMAKPAGE
ncbi:MAG: S41 family peptidase [Gemmatimonadetes bacterium]|nr:S41 family peptidase [Gemmatimonadota bacterium]